MQTLDCPHCGPHCDLGQMTCPNCERLQADLDSLRVANRVFVNDWPMLKEELHRLRKENARLERFKEILRTLLDSTASMEEFHAAVAAVTKRGKHGT